MAHIIEQRRWKESDSLNSSQLFAIVRLINLAIVSFLTSEATNGIKLNEWHAILSEQL